MTTDTTLLELCTDIGTQNTVSTDPKDDTNPGDDL
jgi:hypothetical protein